MKTIIIYKSGSGFVKKYAELISEQLNCDICNYKNADISKMKNYDTVIYGGGLYASGINGIKVIKKNMDILKEKNIVVFFSGASPCREEMLDEVKEKNFTPEQLKKIKVFYMRGGFDFDKLSFPYKIIMGLMKKGLQKKKDMQKEMTEDEKGMLEAFGKPVDYTCRENTQKLVEYIKELEKSKYSEYFFDLRNNFNLFCSWKKLK